MNLANLRCLDCTYSISCEISQMTGRFLVSQSDRHCQLVYESQMSLYQSHDPRREAISFVLFWWYSEDSVPSVGMLIAHGISVCKRATKSHDSNNRSDRWHKMKLLSNIIPCGPRPIAGIKCSTHQLVAHCTTSEFTSPTYSIVCRDTYRLTVYRKYKCFSMVQ